MFCKAMIWVLGCAVLTLVCLSSLARAAEQNEEVLELRSLAAGVTLPSQHGAPPMTTQRSTFAAISGFFASASARLVSGASVTITIPGFASIASMMASTACALAAD